MKNTKLEFPQKEERDYWYWMVKQVIDVVPYGNILSEILSEYLPSSFERRKECKE